MNYIVGTVLNKQHIVVIIWVFPHVDYRNEVCARSIVQPMTFDTKNRFVCYIHPKILIWMINKIFPNSTLLFPV